MFDPNQTQRFMSATKTGAKHARRGYSWASVFVMAVMLAAVCVKVIVEAFA